jgi:hypothetical protein
MAARFISNVNDKIKTTSSTAALFALRTLSGLFVGLTLALIGEEAIGYGVFSFVLVILTMTAAILRISKKWSWMHLLIFNLICVLLGLCLRMYILIAPG